MNQQNLQNTVYEQQQQLRQLTDQVKAQGRLLIAVDDTLQHFKSQAELDFLVVAETYKQEVALALVGEAAGKGIRVFRKILEKLAADKVEGATELHAMTDADLKRMVLGFSSPFKTAAAGKPWKYTLKLKLEATSAQKDLIANLAHSGGNAHIRIRRPLVRQGKLGRDVETWANPDRAKDRKDKQDERVAKAKAARAAKGGNRGASASSRAPVMPPPPPGAPLTGPGVGALNAAAGLDGTAPQRRSQSRSRSPTRDKSEELEVTHPAPGVSVTTVQQS